MYIDQSRLAGKSSHICMGKIRQGEDKAVLSRTDYRQLRGITFHSGEWRDNRFRVRLYRFMAESIPLVSSVIWTWSRLAAAPGGFVLLDGDAEKESQGAAAVLDGLFRRINRTNLGHAGSQDDLLHPFFQSLFLDGAVLGLMELEEDLSGIGGFRFFDLSRSEVEISPSGEVSVVEHTDDCEKIYTGPDLFYYALNADLSNPYGRSILRAVPFVSYVEQQLVDDMRRTMHNAGYHRLHVKITPPERREGETDEAYTSRANTYFDNTVSMIKDIEPEDNPVTWEDVTIEHIGPKGRNGTRTNNWYLSHRAMVEEICSGTHLAPFLLGYSYNATTNWAQFKYDMVMRQVHSVQNAAVNFLNWLADIELSLKGFSLSGKWRFDNKVSALAREQTDIKSTEARYIVELYTAGLIDKDTASDRAARLV
jgi:hypothetical protein